MNKNQSTRQRRPTSDHQVLYSVGGMSRREASKSGEKYDPKEGKWTPICKLLSTLRYSLLVAAAAESFHGLSIHVQISVPALKAKL